MPDWIPLGKLGRPRRRRDLRSGDHGMADGRRAWATPLRAAVLAAWLVALAVPPALLVSWRDQRLAEVSSPQAQADWDAFRADMRRQSDRAGPVQRKVPKSAEPPELVWLRDYLHLAIIAWVSLVGVLGGFLGALAIGMTRTASAAQDQPPGGRDHKK